VPGRERALKGQSAVAAGRGALVPHAQQKSSATTTCDPGDVLSALCATNQGQKRRDAMVLRIRLFMVHRSMKSVDLHHFGSVLNPRVLRQCSTSTRCCRTGTGCSKYCQFNKQHSSYAPCHKRSSALCSGKWRFQAATLSLVPAAYKYACQDSMLDALLPFGFGCTEEQRHEVFTLRKLTGLRQVLL